MSNRLTDEDLIKTYDTFIKTGGSVKRTSEIFGMRRYSIRNRLDKAGALLGVDWKKPIVSGNLKGFETKDRKLPAKNKAKVYILTTAQNNTEIHQPFWDNLLAYAEHTGAELLVSQFAYNKTAYGRWRPDENKPGKAPTEEYMDDLWFDPAIEGYVCNDRLNIAPKLTFCGELNILPTAVRPLSGFESYPGEGRSAIFPHTTIAMQSIPSLAEDDTKFNYSTGCVTTKNYIQKKAGLKADFHHTYGALIVEIDHAGDFWVRQLNTNDTGTFQDLDVVVAGGLISTGHPLEAINWGDVHVEVADPGIAELNWGKGGILDTFKPKYQFMHDTLDFHSRNHHRIKNPHAMFERYIDKKDNVEHEVKRVVEFLNTDAYRPDCETIAIDSNHDNALEKWLREADYRIDPANAIFFLKCQLMKYTALRDKVSGYHLIEALLQDLGAREDIVFLREGESFLICNGKIECGMHGHLGANGARGNPLTFSKTGSKTNTGHTHSACIIQGAYVSGTCSYLTLEYNTGLSSWSHSHIFTYPTGKRAIITIKKNLYRPACLLP